MEGGKGLFENEKCKLGSDVSFESNVGERGAGGADLEMNDVSSDKRLGCQEIVPVSGLDIEHFNSLV